MIQQATGTADADSLRRNVVAARPALAAASQLRLASLLAPAATLAWLLNELAEWEQASAPGILLAGAQFIDVADDGRWYSIVADANALTAPRLTAVGPGLAPDRATDLGRSLSAVLPLLVRTAIKPLANALDDGDIHVEHFDSCVMFHPDFFGSPAWFEGAGLDRLAAARMPLLATGFSELDTAFDHAALAAHGWRATDPRPNPFAVANPTVLRLPARWGALGYRIERAETTDAAMLADAKHWHARLIDTRRRYLDLIRDRYGGVAAQLLPLNEPGESHPAAESMICVGGPWYCDAADARLFKIFGPGAMLAAAPRKADRTLIEILQASGGPAERFAALVDWLTSDAGQACWNAASGT